jgi:ABC-type transporter Mla subunit MlaD
MNPRRRRGALAGSPLLIGALTTLIAIVAVYISYNANNGLPFAPTYDIKAELPEGSGLQNGNEVRLSGKRVGVVSGLAPHQNPATGRVTAIVDLKLEKSVEPLAADTKTLVESVSTIGLKYLELTPGHSRRTIATGGTIPVSQSTEPVEFQNFFNIFNKPTRIAIQKSTNVFGNGLAERGLGLNETIHELRPLVKNGVPVLHNLASPQTDLRQLFVAFDKAATQVAPVAEEQAAFYVDLDTVLTAWAKVAPSLERTIEGGPATLRQAIYSFPHEAPFIEKATEFMRLLRPSASVLRTTAAPLGHAIQVGAVNLRAASATNKQLANALQGFRAFSENPIVTLGLEEFTKTVQLGSPLLAGLAPEQMTCNYVTLALRNLSNLMSENVGVGTMARAVPILSPTGPNNEGLPASAPADGGSVEREVSGASTAAGKIILNNYLHYNPYPNVSGPGQPTVCEAGNQSYTVGKTVIGASPITAGASTLHETTKRGENAFGEKYPSSTLKNFPAEANAKPSQGKNKGKQK